jgi:hypothetical protein
LNNKIETFAACIDSGFVVAHVSENSLKIIAGGVDL